MEMTAMDGDGRKTVYQIGEVPIAQFGFPNSYLVFDLETTGVADDDLVVAIALLLVKPNEPPLAHSYLLDWTRYGQHVSQAGLSSRLASVQTRRGSPSRIFNVRAWTRWPGYAIFVTCYTVCRRRPIW
jgi:hypothetical protein